MGWHCLVGWVGAHQPCNGWSSITQKRPPAVLQVMMCHSEDNVQSNWRYDCDCSHDYDRQQEREGKASAAPPCSPMRQQAAPAAPGPAGSAMCGMRAPGRSCFSDAAAPDAGAHSCRSPPAAALAAPGRWPPDVQTSQPGRAARQSACRSTVKCGGFNATEHGMLSRLSSMRSTPLGNYHQQPKPPSNPPLAAAGQQQQGRCRRTPAAAGGPPGRLWRRGSPASSGMPPAVSIRKMWVGSSTRGLFQVLDDIAI